MNPPTISPAACAFCARARQLRGSMFCTRHYAKLGEWLTLYSLTERYEEAGPDARMQMVLQWQRWEREHAPTPRCPMCQAIGYERGVCFTCGYGAKPVGRKRRGKKGRR